MDEELEQIIVPLMSQAEGSSEGSDSVTECYEPCVSENEQRHRQEHNVTTLPERMISRRRLSSSSTKGEVKEVY